MRKNVRALRFPTLRDTFPQRQSCAAWPIYFCGQQSHRHLANIRDDHVSLVGSTIKPTPSPQTVQDKDEPPIPGLGRNNHPPDERTLKLGESKSTSRKQNVMANISMQLSKNYMKPSRSFSPNLCPLPSSRQTSHSTSSPRRTLTSQPSLAVSLTQPPCTPLQ